MKSPLLINNNSPIGIFDSGLGGLTVLQKIQEVLPNENYIYFGDIAHLPYGSKSNKCIIEYSKKIIEFLLQKNVKAIIIACNSASSVAIETIKKNYDIPIFEVITPATIRAVEQTKTKHICVIGTETTISSKIYSKKICEFNNAMNTMEIACPLLVPIIEEGLENTDIAFEIVKLYLNPILNTKIDTLILGCTHYPIISKQLDNLLLNNIHYISSGLPLAQHLNDYLIFNKMINLNNKVSTEFYVSDSPKKFQMLGSKFLHNKISNVQLIQL